MDCSFHPESWSEEHSAVGCYELKLDEYHCFTCHLLIDSIQDPGAQWWGWGVEWKKQVSSHQRFIDCAKKNWLSKQRPFREHGGEELQQWRVMSTGIFKWPDYKLSHHRIPEQIWPQRARNPALRISTKEPRRQARGPGFDWNGLYGWGNALEVSYLTLKIYNSYFPVCVLF